MTNTVYNYPKSSCDCYNCQHTNNYGDNVGLPTNMSVRNCNVPNVFNCYNQLQFGQNIVPMDKKGETILNPQIIKDNIPKDFQRISCNYPQSCNSTQYASPDPRLISVPHTQVLTLDRPPIESTPIFSKNIATDIKLNNYGQNYKGYNDINAGQVLYYVNHQLEDPFYNPVFTIPSVVDSILYKDPMDSIKPQYYRTPVYTNNLLNTKGKEYYGGLSFLEDSMYQREDIMGLQLLNRNQQRYEPRWYN